MSATGDITAVLSQWIDTVARVVSTPIAGVHRVRRIAVVEDDSGGFTMSLAQKAAGKDGDLQPCSIELTDHSAGIALSPEWAAAVRGSVVDLALQPSRFVFRPLELPSRAAEFLDGIIRAQIDRLTPWSAAEAVYRWTPPHDVAGERISLTVVATGRAAVTSLAQVFSDLGAVGVKISTDVAGRDRVTVYDQRAAGQTGFGRTRLALIAALAATGLLASLSSVASGFMADSYAGQHQQIQRRIAEQRAIMRGGQNGAASSPLELLMRRKQTTRSSVLVMDALSALLPEHTYATEVRIEGDKLQIVGVTRDAPSLIQILEQSPHFASAGFYAPTTRSANETTERFHIEARLKPHFGSGT